MLTSQTLIANSWRSTWHLLLRAPFRHRCQVSRSRVPTWWPSRPSRLNQWLPSNRVLPSRNSWWWPSLLTLRMSSPELLEVFVNNNGSICLIIYVSGEGCCKAFAWSFGQAALSRRDTSKAGLCILRQGSWPRAFPGQPRPLCVSEWALRGPFEGVTHALTNRLSDQRVQSYFQVRSWPHEVQRDFEAKATTMEWCVWCFNWFWVLLSCSWHSDVCWLNTLLSFGCCFEFIHSLVHSFWVPRKMAFMPKAVVITMETHCWTWAAMMERPIL